jgi:type III secretion apparatus needle protein
MSGIGSLTATTNTMGTKTKEATDSLESIISNLKADDPQYLFKMSQAMTKWSLAIQTQSQMMKEMSDALKGIIQKM